MNPLITIALMGLAAGFAAVANLAGESAVRWWRARRTPKCGRLVCAWCKPQRDLGPSPLMRVGEITHGICPECRQREFSQFAA